MLAAGISALLAVGLGALAGYGLARTHMRGKKHLAFWIISTRMAPIAAVVVPLFLIFRGLGLIDSIPGLVLAYLTFNLPFAIWLMSAFFAEVPASLEESALVAGCTPLAGLLARSSCPLTKSGLVTTFVLCLVFAWNDYAFAVVFSGPELPDAAHRRLPARHPDRHRLGPAHRDRHDRGRADDARRARRAPLAGHRAHPRRRHRGVGGPCARPYCTGSGKITLEERPRPEPGPREVLVRVASVGTCGSDVHYYEHGRIGDFVVESPLVLGHEPSGTVVATGPGASRHRLGQRVSLEPGVPDFTCRAVPGRPVQPLPAACGSSAPRRSTAPSASTSSSTRSSPTPSRTPCPMTPPP